MDYFTNAILAAVLWGILTLVEANLAKQKIYGPLFLKLLIFGISSLIVFLFYKKNIYDDLNSLWKTNKNGGNFICIIINGWDITYTTLFV